MKVVINVRYGGYSLSKEAYEELGIPWDGYGVDFKDKRSDPGLIRVVEKLGKEANGFCSKLKIVEIPDDVDWNIFEHAGLEHVAEKHRTWS